MPLRVCASMFLMPLTLVLIEYWLYVVTRCSISGTLRPVYCQITDTTGMLISRKMSSGMTTMAETEGRQDVECIWKLQSKSNNSHLDILVLDRGKLPIAGS